MKKYVYISGGGSGIGFETARLCFNKGWTPILLGRREDVLLKASKKLQDCPFLAVDLSKEASKKEVRSHFGDLPQGELLGIVNNAGIYKPSSFLDSTSQDWSEQFNVNVLSAVYLSQEFFKELKKSKGSVVNVSSSLSIRPIPNTGAYSASKAAMNNLTQTMALEFAASGVRVNCICPGIVNTPIHSNSQGESEASLSQWKDDLKSAQPLGRIGEVSDVAPTVIHLLDAEASKWTTGCLINIDGGILLNS